MEPKTGLVLERYAFCIVKLCTQESDKGKEFSRRQIRETAATPVAPLVTDTIKLYFHGEHR